MIRVTILLLAVANVGWLRAEGPAQIATSVSKTATFPMQLGGTVRFPNSHGDLYIEGWDRPEAEITITKSTRYHDPHLATDKASSALSAIEVTTEARSGAEIQISTKGKKKGVDLEYRIHLPRNTRLEIQHRGGSVTVENIAADMNVSNRDGDIVLMLPDHQEYAVDARCRMGHIASDFDGKTSSRTLVGQRFRGNGSRSVYGLRLRTGFGGITLVAVPPEGQGLSVAK
jgi:hypothetical protein